MNNLEQKYGATKLEGNKLNKNEVNEFKLLKKRRHNGNEGKR